MEKKEDPKITSMIEFREVSDFVEPIISDLGEPQVIRLAEIISAIAGAAIIESVYECPDNFELVLTKLDSYFRKEYEWDHIVKLYDDLLDVPSNWLSCEVNLSEVHEMIRNGIDNVPECEAWFSRKDQETTGEAWSEYPKDVGYGKSYTTMKDGVDVPHEMVRGSKYGYIRPRDMRAFTRHDLETRAVSTINMKWQYEVLFENQPI